LNIFKVLFYVAFCDEYAPQVCYTDPSVPTCRHLKIYNPEFIRGIIPPLLLEILYGFLIWIGISKYL